MGKGGCIPTAQAVSSNIQKNANAKLDSSSSSVTLKRVTPTLLATKTTINECWIAYEGGVYDVTHWLPKHPGGIRSIMSAAGSDASSVIKSLHAPKTLETFIKRIRKVGIMVKEEEEEKETNVDGVDNVAVASAANKKTKQLKTQERSEAIHKDFQKLNQKLLDENWYEAQPLDYIFPIARVMLFLYVGVQMIFWADSATDSSDTVFPVGVLKGLALILGSMSLGMYLQNIAFLGHDAGHGSITGNFRSDLWFGMLVGNAFAGIDVSWWKSTHYVHHSATNSLHDDPDIQHMPILCFDERYSGNEKWWSSYHGRYLPTLDPMGIGRVLMRYQHWYYYPVMAVARINLYIQSFLHLARTCPLFTSSSSLQTTKNATDNVADKKVIDETTGQVKEQYAWPTPTPSIWIASVVTISVYWVLIYSFLSQLQISTAIVSFAVCHLTAGLLHVQILLSHVAMHYCEEGHGTHEAITAPNGNDAAGYYEWQALSTMDVDCPPWMDWFHGGLQFQLEHHLFPRLPRWKLRKLCRLTDEIFLKYQIPVVRIPFVEANKMVLLHLQKVGEVVAAKMKSV